MWQINRYDRAQRLTANNATPFTNLFTLVALSNVVLTRKISSFRSKQFAMSSYHPYSLACVLCDFQACRKMGIDASPFWDSFVVLVCRILHIPERKSQNLLNTIQSSRIPLASDSRTSDRQNEIVEDSSGFLLSSSSHLVVPMRLQMLCWC